MERLTEPRDVSDDDRELAADPLGRMPPEDIAAALVHSLRASLPEPEELASNTPEGREKAKQDRHRPGFEDVVWFKIGVGRRQNAEPRWILPLLCRRGHITRNEIGAIRIGQHESWFQVPSTIAPKFAKAVERTASAEDEQDAIPIEEAPEGPRVEARQNRKFGNRDNADGPRVRPKPFGKGPGKGPGHKPGAPFRKGPGKGPAKGKKFAGKFKGGKPARD